MIYAEFFIQPNGGLVGFSIRGHNGMEGEDIICAAVSSAAYMTVNTITDIIKADSRVTVEDGYMLVKILQKEIGSCHTIFAGFKLHMLGLEEQYPQNINVSYTEV